MVLKKPSIQQSFMQLSEAGRRRVISAMVKRKEYSRLAELGLEIVELTGDYDCEHHVLKALRLTANDDTLSALRRLRGQGTPLPGIVFYLQSGNSPEWSHAGLFNGGRVLSKWNKPGPLVRHRIEDVPVGYGNVAMFRRQGTALPALIDALQGRLFQTDMGY